VNYFEVGSDGNTHLFAQPETDTVAALNAARAAQAKAEQQAREARAAQEKAEQQARSKKDVWVVANLVNRTKTEITYLIEGEKIRSKLPPRSRVTLSRLNQDSIVIKYTDMSDMSVVPFAEKTVSLQSTAVVGHEPTESDKANSRVNYFTVIDRRLYIYSEPPFSRP